MTTYTEVTRKDWMKVIGYMILLIVIIMIGGVLFLPDQVHFFIVLMIFIIYFIIRWHTANFGYRCPKCSHDFSISFWQNFFGPNFIDKKLLKCPKCNKRDFCRVVKKIN